MKKKGIIFFVIGLAVIVCLVVIGVNYFNNLKPYKLSLPEINDVKKISLKFDKYQNDSTNVHTIKEIFKILNNVKKRTYKESVQEYPNDVNDLIEISFYAFEKNSSNFIHEEENLFYNNVITIYAYAINNKYYLEQSYNGIYKITEENYNDLKDIYNDINFMSCLADQMGAYIMSEISELKDMPLSTFTSNKDEILYYKSSYTDAENIYAVVKSYDAEVIRDFDRYFSSKYDVYQTYFVKDSTYIYVHNKVNDIDFKDLKKCSANKINNKVVKEIDSKIIEKLNKTNKIVISFNDSIIDNKNAINEILDIISSGKQYGTAALCDGHSYELLMYNDDTLIDTIYVWENRNRLIPKSIHSGCSYYTVGDSNLMEIIERETGYISYNLFSLTNSCEENKKIYSDEKYNYYLNCKERGNVLIKFNTKNLIMNLKYALDNNYISIELLSVYDDMIIKEEK
ncbi:MAG: DUF5301 domain-containing protein [Bacilli bacterium]|nr:DUF5301 domain-containing protein [Bacilli bacterium]